MQEPECIAAFEARIPSFAGSWWAPESALPCPKPELLDALLVAREAAYRADFECYEALTQLIGDLTLFIPDEDLEATRPFLTPGGRIGGRPSDPRLENAHETAYELLTAHLTERRRVLPFLDMADDHGRRPIGEQR
jgi:hypothetical protein